MSEKLRIAFVGLGVMGSPIAGHLAKNGHTLVVHNRTRVKEEQWLRENEGISASIPAEAAKSADVVVLCVGNDKDVREVLAGSNGAFKSLNSGSLVIDHTTASPAVERELAEQAAALGIGYVDAPVSGGEAGARSGKLSIMAGGSLEDYQRAEPLLHLYGGAVTHMGPVGSGQATKLVNQICIAAALQGVAEAINFGQKLGLDMTKALAVLAKGAAQSWQLENRGPWMLDGRYTGGGFAVNLMKKDLDLCLSEAGHNNSRLPVANLVAEFFSQLQKDGKGAWDFSSLYALLHDSEGGQV